MASSARRRRAKTPSSSTWTNTTTYSGMDNFSFILGSQIRYLVSSLTKKTIRANSAELEHLIKLYGNDAFLYLFRCLVEQIDFTDHKGQKDQYRIQLLQQQIGNVVPQANFASIILQALAGLDMKEEFLSQFCKVLKLPLVQEILVGLSLAQSPEKTVELEGKRFLKSKIPELAQNVSLLPDNILHPLLYFLRTTEGFSKHRSNLLRALQKSHANDGSFSISVLSGDGERNMDSKRKFDDFVNSNLEKEHALVTKIAAACHPADLMRDLGYSCCSSPAILKELFGQFSVLSELDVARILTMMASTQVGLDEDRRLASPNEKQEVKWNTDAFVSTLAELYPSLSWAAVINSFDSAGLVVDDQKVLIFILSVYKKATKEPFPIDCLLGRWTNAKGQLSFLKFAVFAPPDIINFASPQYVPLELPHPNKNASALVHNWDSLPLVETLLELAEVEDYSLVRGVFDYPLEHCPELLLLKLGQAKPTWGAMHAELCSILLPMFLASHPNSSFVLHKLWPINRSLVMQGMIDMYSKDSTCLSRLLDVAHDIKALSPVLELQPFAFAIDLAALAARREYLNLEKWLQDRIDEHQGEFIKACITYLKEKKRQVAKIESSQKPDRATTAIVLSPETFSIFCTCLQANLSLMSPELVEEFEQLQLSNKSPQPVPAAPSPSALSSPSQSSTALPTSEKEVFPPDIEGTANQFFQSVYTGKMSIEDMVQLLKNFKSSKNKREQQIFSCMIHNLFDEYRFFQRYPDKELAITGILFGALIQHQLVSFIPLGIALRYVLEALKKPSNTKMFKFGVVALQQFKSRLAEWPQYCSHILQIPHIRQLHPEIVEHIEGILGGMPKEDLPVPPPGIANLSPPSNPLQPPTPIAAPIPSHPLPPQLLDAVTTPPPSTPPVSTPSPEAAAKSTPALPKASAKLPENTPVTPFMQLVPSDTLLGAITVGAVPDEAIKDKIFFVFNNVSLQNLDAKVAELKATLTSDHWSFLAQHLVINRASVEPNFHQLYLQFLDKLKLPALTQMALDSTYGAIKALLKSPKIITQTSERSLLKNLGSWLGHLTLARNKPLIHKDLALKELVFEAYEKGRLIAVIPFVCKVLEACSKSKIFAPPNVWVMAHMRLLVEIYMIPELKLNLKFEIELLCNNLGVDLNEIKPSKLLEERTRDSTSDLSVEKPPSPSPHPPDATDTHPSPPQPDAGAPGTSWRISPHPLFVQQPALKRYVAVAIDRAIKEIITPVMERSATIASITTRELVLKDFAMEPNEQNMRKAAHAMVQSLAGSLALVTCKEPLRVSIGNHLRALLQASVAEAQRGLIEHAVQAVSADNLDMACAFIERTTTEKAVALTDEALAAAFEARVKHREHSGGQPFIDVNFFSGRYPSSLPKPLQPKPGGLMPHQKRVYEDFAEAAGAAATNAAAASPSLKSSLVPYPQELAKGGTPIGEAVGYSGAQGATIPTDPRLSVTKVKVKKEKLTTREALQKFKGLMGDLNAAVVNTISTSYAALEEGHVVRNIVESVPVLIMQAASYNEVALALAQKVFKRLYEKTEPAILMDIHITILLRIHDLCKSVVKELTNWILYSDNDRKFHKKITPSLINGHLIKVSDFDAHLAKKMDGGRNKAALEFSIHMVAQCLVEADPVTVSPTELFATIDALDKVARRNAGPEGLTELLAAARAATPSPSSSLRSSSEKHRTGEKRSPRKLSQSKDDIIDPAQEQVVAVFEEWKRICQQPNQSEKTVAPFVAQLQRTVLQADEAVQKKFFLICTKLVIDQTLSISQSPQLTYRSVDALSKLVVLSYKCGGDSRLSLLTKVLDSVVQVLIKNYDGRKLKFNQRPFFRLFASLLIDLNAATPESDPSHLQLLLAFSNTFMVLAPTRLPGFCMAWLELVSHRNFMPKLLLSKSQQGWPLFQQLLVELFKFLEPYLRTAELTDPIRLLYKGTLRVLLVLLHDFPEFLCDYHFSFCDGIPATCIQMRNLILSAFPRNMRLPDPFTPNLKVDLLPEINSPPRILSNYTAALTAQKGFKQELDAFLKSGGPISFVLELRSRLLLPSAPGGGTRYNIPLINALVLYVGAQAVLTLQTSSSHGTSPITQSAPMDIFQHLAMDLDSEGRYVFLNAIANQLRYPNNHTHYFSCVLLYLFAEANQASQEVIQEQITRVLLERLIVNRPHPWGLLITFIELIKNPRYNFWSHNFTRCAPEIERLFESVARSCMAPPVGSSASGAQKKPDAPNEDV